MTNQSYTSSTSGLQSYIEASPEYELAPIGIASMRDQVQRLAEFGRNGDVYVIHAAEGETVVPMEVLEANPQIKSLLFNQMAEMGLDPQRYVVGDQLNSLNPVTGMPEFFFSSIFKSIKKAVKSVVKIAKKLAPIAIPIAAAMFGVPFLGPMFGAGTIGASMLGSGIGSLLGGASLKDSFKAAAIGGLTTAGTSFLTGGIGGLQSSFTGKTPFSIPGTDTMGYKVAASPWSGGASGQASAAQWDAIKSGNIFEAAVPDFLGGGDYGTPIFDEAGTQIGTQQMGGTFSPLSTGESVYKTPISTTSLIDGPGPSADFVQESLAAAAGSPGSNMAGTLAPDLNVEQPGWWDKAGDYAFRGGQSTTQIASDVAKAEGAYVAKMAELGIPPTEQGLKAAAASAQPGMFAQYGPLLAVGGLGAAAMGAFDTAEEEEITEADLPDIGGPRLTLAERQALADEQELQQASINPFLFTPSLDVEQRTIFNVAAGGSIDYPERDLLVEGPGTERSDDIPAMLSDGEFVINSRAVRGADPSGGGNRYAGAQNLYNLMRNFEMRA